MFQRARRSISVPIVLASVTVALSVALLVGWVWVSMPARTWSDALSTHIGLLLWGTLSLGVIIAVLVLFCVSLVRGMLEARRQDSLIDAVTHELNSPLASIKLCLETMGRPEVSLEQHARLRGMMLADVERLHVFIGDVLQATRVMHGENHGYALSDVDVKPFLQRMITAVQERYNVSSEVFQLHAQEDVHVYSDATALETIVRNVLDNAVKYSDDVKEITVRGYVYKNMWVLEVQDRGIGIPAHALKRVFDRFYRVPDEKVRRRRGTGLGLFVVASLVRHMGGKVRVFSEGVGCGTRMQVMLPMHAPHKAGV
jgi:signal transduction histidine kinase